MMDNEFNFEAVLEEAFAEGTPPPSDGGAGVGDNGADSQNAADNDGVGDDDTHSPNNGDDSGADAGKPHKNDKNAHFAERRRAAEQKAAAYQKDVENYFKSRGFSSFEDAKKQAQEEALNKEVGQFGFSGKDIAPAVQAIVNNMPEMQEARRIAEETQRREQELALQSEMQKITALDPAIKTVEDLFALDTAEVFDDLVLNKGIPMADAFKLANHDRLLQQATAAAAQKAKNDVNSKSHLHSGSGGASEDVVVPDDVLAEYELYNPDATLEEIKKHYKKSLS